MTIHWCGTGLSAIPGLKRALAGEAPVVVWNRSVDKARAALGPEAEIRAFDPEALGEALAPGDIVVSMLPGDWHVPLAERAIAAGAHFVSSSYISPEMRALDQAAQEASVALVNEVGLDPGIDHLMAHDLVARWRAAPEFDPKAELSFTSYCGGVPKEAGGFRYKFSWSPLGVLKALRSPSRALAEGETRDVARPWHAVSRYEAPLPTPEAFEVYPNRDSLPFMAEYGFAPEWPVRDFVRGTLRLEGWADAWAPIFAEVEALEGADPEAAEARLAALADELWERHAYDEGEPDRVVLFVDLAARKEGRTIWHKIWALDAWGDGRGTAMARLVSNTVALALEALGEGALSPGVQAAPSDPALVARWLADTSEQAQHMELVDRLG